MVREQKEATTLLLLPVGAGGKVVVAVYPFTAIEDGDLTLVKASAAFSHKIEGFEKKNAFLFNNPHLFPSGRGVRCLRRLAGPLVGSQKHSR